MVIILVYVTLPFMILSLIGPLRNIDETIVQAAQVCGAAPWRVFTSVVPLLVGGKVGQQFLAVVVDGSMNTFQDWGLGAAAAAILLVVSLGTVLVYNALMKRLRVGVVLPDGFAE